MTSLVQPVPDASLAVAADNIAIFAAEVREKAAIEGEVRQYSPAVGDPRRDETGDADGRFCWQLPVNGCDQAILMPGVAVAVLLDLSASAPLVGVNGNWAWWHGATGVAIPLPAEQPWLAGGPAKGRAELPPRP